MDKKDMICIVCPIGCRINVVEDETIEGGYRVDGANCKRGKLYGVKELTRPTRLLTTTVKIDGGGLTRIPVRTDKEIPKDKIFDCMRLINDVELKVPVKMGQVVIENILDLDVNIIASRSMDS